MPPKYKDIMRRLEEEGWYIDRTRGSHRQYKHPVKPGLVTVPGRPSEDSTPGTYQSILKQAGWKK